MEGNLLVTLRNLLKLQQIDSELDDINESTGDLPIEIKSLQNSLTNLQDKLKQNEAKLSELRSNRSNANITIQELRDKLEKLTDRLGNVKNNKEYEATNNEIDSAKTDITNFERSLGVLDSEEVAIMKIVENYKSEIEEKSEELKDKQQVLEELTSDYADDIAELNKVRLTLIPEIPSDILTSYQHIRTACNDVVVRVKKGSCAGCYRSVTPQILVEVRKNEKIYKCESCGRILVSEEIES